MSGVGGVLAMGRQDREIDWDLGLNYRLEE